MFFSCRLSIRTFSKKQARFVACRGCLLARNCYLVISFCLVVNASELSLLAAAADGRTDGRDGLILNSNKYS